jgi:hypothetical protein
MCIEATHVREREREREREKLISNAMILMPFVNYFFTIIWSLN